MARYEDYFSKGEYDVGMIDSVEHHIKTNDTAPIRQIPYRTPQVKKVEINRQIDEMLATGLIVPSKSPWLSPVVLVKKKNGKWRMCIDYRKLNAITKKDSFPLPRIDDVLDMLGKAKMFSTIDLAAGYNQVSVAKADREKTAFITHDGLYEYAVMPFGLCNASPTFQRMMQEVLLEHRKYSLVYLDDIIIFSPDEQQHLIDVEKIVKAIGMAGLKMRKEKCEFFQTQVHYLGYRISTDGIQPNEEKIRAMNEFPTPGNVKGVQSFLGLAGFY
jgi:hypothetical protein